ncbi:MAG: Sua5/YciO/YrdC/YwlC family protein [Promethearchaeota archaeon]
MGLILKYRPSQQDQWRLFHQHMFDVFKEGKLIGLPFGKAGYGFVGDPTKPQVMELFLKMLGDDFINDVLFLVDSTATAQEWGNFYPITEQVTNRFWPGDLVIHLPFNHLPDNPLQTQIFDKNPELETTLLQHSIRVLVPKHPVTQSVFAYLRENSRAPLLMGFFGELETGFNAQDAIALMNGFGGDEVGVIMDAGRLQKSKRVYPATQVGIFDNDGIQIEITGKISAQNLAEFIKDDTLDPLADFDD